MPRGELKLIIGNMFANKTGTLIHMVETIRAFGKKRVLVLKPTTDTRSGESRIKNYHGKELEAAEVPVASPWETLQVVANHETERGSHYHVLAFDEVQFFPAGSAFFQVIDTLLDRGYDVVAAGLALDFKREPFGSTLLLLGLCHNSHNCTWLMPLCARCGNPAPLPQRLIDGKPAPYGSPQVHVGGKESYEARCYDCHELPGKPTAPR